MPLNHVAGGIECVVVGGHARPALRGPLIFVGRAYTLAVDPVGLWQYLVSNGQSKLHVSFQQKRRTEKHRR